MKKILLSALLVVSCLLFLTYLNTAKAADLSLLPSPWHLTGNNGDAQAYQSVSSNILSGQDKIRLSYNLHGLCALGGDASAVIFDQNGWKYTSLSKYGQNCLDGNQTVEIPLTDFGLNLSEPLTGSFHTRFWYGGGFTVDITQATLFNSATFTTTPPPPDTTGTTSGSTSVNGVNLLSSPWTLSANFGAVEKYQTVAANILSGNDTLRITYNLNGLKASGGDASAVIFDQNGWKYVSLSKYGQNGKTGDQTVDIPLSNFAGLDVTKPLTGSFHTRFWSNKPYNVVISSAAVYNSTGTAPEPAAQAPTPTPTSTAGTWAIQSVDAMKDTKDAICGQRDRAWIDRWVGKAVEVGANYVAISTPYENPSCGDAQAYTRRWVDAIRARGLKVWFRQMPLAFEGIYSVAKNSSNNFLSLIGNYIKANADMYQPGDIFTPIPEPQNGGISGITYCAGGVCQFSGAAAFNQWLRNAMTTANQAFQTAGKSGMKVGYFGFDGFTVWGDNNPDWNGILEDATISMMGNITIDHYPEIVGDTMANDLNELHARYPGVDIIIGEWGTITGGTNTPQQVQNSMGAAKAAAFVKGFNYWQFGPSGAGEQLIDNNFVSLAQFSSVQSFYKGN